MTTTTAAAAALPKIRLQFCKSDSSCGEDNGICSYGGCVGEKDMRYKPPRVCKKVNYNANVGSSHKRDPVDAAT